MKRPSRPPAHTRYLSSPAEATLHKLHATFMQPLQCVSQHHVANLHVSITWQHQMTTIMQPFHSDLQAQIQDTHRTTHTGTTTRCRTQRRNTFADETAQPPPRTHEVPLIAGRSHFTGKNTRFRAPASSPTQAPCNIHATITMRFAASRRKPARIYAHGNTR